MVGVYLYHRTTIKNYKSALIQWQRWGVQMRRNLGWTDSYLRTRVKSTNGDARTKVWKNDPTGGSGGPPMGPPRL